ncbi:MAG: methyltransferase [Kangiella sp.]|nr:MAG: methyltransferase [Kangiella sp.]
MIEDDVVKGSTARFGHSWNIFSEILPIHEEQFIRWTTGLSASDFKGKSFIDVGCGIGRNSYWPFTYGAKSCLAIDLDERTLAVAKENLSSFKDAKVERRSAYEINEDEQFDIAFSIGVLHHVEEPDRALQSMIKSVKPRGKVLAWLYGYENNEKLVRYFNPFRKLLFSKLPLPVVFVFSAPLTLVLWCLLRVGLNRTQYLRLIRQFSFRHLRAIVYDHMVPRIAKYYKKEEARAFFEDAGLVNVEVHWVNEMSWTVIGTKK